MRQVHSDDESPLLDSKSTFRVLLLLKDDSDENATKRREHHPLRIDIHEDDSTLAICLLQKQTNLFAQQLLGTLHISTLLHTHA